MRNRTLPGAKQIYRSERRDVVALAGECMAGEPLLDPILSGGCLVHPLPDAAAARAHTAESLARLSGPQAVEYSRGLLGLLERVRGSMEATRV